MSVTDNEGVSALAADESATQPVVEMQAPEISSSDDAAEELVQARDESSSQIGTLEPCLNQQKQHPVPFLLIDAKSMPRAGLHYLKNALQWIFQDGFSFCEWYQEVGCCRQRPCALTCYREESVATGRPHVRLIKSHDFQLTDPRHDLDPMTERVIMVREPVAELTSFFLLDELVRHAALLREDGLHPEKLLYQHEGPVTRMACRILDGGYQPQSDAEIFVWLIKKVSYLQRFSAKWVHAVRAAPMQNERVVKYSEVPDFIRHVVSVISDRTDPDHNKSAAWQRRCDAMLEQFQPRLDPFVVPSARVTEVIQRLRGVFEAAANEVVID